MPLSRSSSSMNLDNSLAICTITSSSHTPAHERTSSHCEFVGPAKQCRFSHQFTVASRRCQAQLSGRLQVCCLAAPSYEIQPGWSCLLAQDSLTAAVGFVMLCCDVRFLAQGSFVHLARQSQGVHRWKTASEVVQSAVACVLLHASSVSQNPDMSFINFMFSISMAIAMIWLSSCAPACSEFTLGQQLGPRICVLFSNEDTYI